MDYQQSQQGRNQRTYGDQRPPYQPRDNRGPNNRNFNNGGSRPPYQGQGQRPQGQRQGGWNNGGRNFGQNRGPRPQGDRPAGQRKKLPGTGNPKENYLRIKPGSTFTVKGGTTQVKLIATDSYKELQFAMNRWLAKYGDDIKVVDIKYSVAAYYGCSCCIIYHSYDTTEVKTVTFAPETKDEAPASVESETPQADGAHPEA